MDANTRQLEAIFDPNVFFHMSKQDSELKVDDAKIKNFWRSPMPKEPDGRGAPRKNRDGMVLVKRMLGGERSKYPPGFEPPKLVRTASGVRIWHPVPAVEHQFGSTSQSQGL